MGWTVLYIAFGIVALWLLGEVLLQYKARLRWRLLAFAGFLGVVLGVLIPSVVVIALGAAAFAVGQTYVTLSFRRGFAEGWAFRRTDADGHEDEGADTAGALGFLSKRRRGKAERQDPSLEGSDLQTAEAGFDVAASYRTDDTAFGQNKNAYGDDDFDRDDVFTPAARGGDPMAAETTSVYEPQPLPDETGTYGIYSDAAYAAATGQAQQQGQPQDQYATAAQGADQNYGYDNTYSGYHQQQYGYDATGEQQYAAYSDPYIGTQTYGGGSYDAGYGQQQYGQQGYGQDQYGTGGYGETPAGGVWVPQQRNTDDPLGGELPPEQQQYPYQGDGQQPGQGQGNGYDEQQYRF
ncbi:SCO2102 family sporulation regulator [Streptomyces sp. NPDC001858]